MIYQYKRTRHLYKGGTMIFTIYETAFSDEVDYAEVDLDKSKYKYSFYIVTL